MRGFIKKIKGLLSTKEPEWRGGDFVSYKLHDSDTDFRTLEFRSRLVRLFMIDPIPHGCVPLYDVEPGSEVIVVQDNAPQFRAPDRQVFVELGAKMTDALLLDCLTFAVKYAKKGLKGIDTEQQYYGGCILTGEKELSNLKYTTIHVPEFAHTLYIPDPEYFGVISTIDGKYGVMIVLDNVRVLSGPNSAT